MIQVGSALCHCQNYQQGLWHTLPISKLFISFIFFVQSGVLEAQAGYKYAVGTESGIIYMGSTLSLTIWVMH
jgi:hypothetical protein